MKRLLLLLFTVFFSPLVLAQQTIGQTTGSTIGSSGNLSLTPPPGDFSISLLSNIFGSVDGVLHGTGSQLLGSMFGLFNAAVLFLGGIVVLYTLLISTLNTAHEGEVLGKDWSSIWVPLKMVAGIALLIPKASGYSFIQIFMMWVAVMGVGAADSIWNATADYLSFGGPVIQQNQQIPSSLINNSGTVFKSLTCSFMLQNQLNKYRDAQISSGINTLPAVPNFYQEILNAANALKGNATLQFPPSTLPAPYNNLAGACGSVSWNAVAAKTVLPDYMFASDGTVAPQYQYVMNSYADAKKQAISALLSNLMPGAMLVATNYNNNKLPLGKVLSTSPLQWGWDQNGSYVLPGALLSDSAASYMAVMSPVVRSLEAPMDNAAYAGFGDVGTRAIAKSKDDGWALASTYYYDISQANSYVLNAWNSAADFSVTGPSADLSNAQPLTNILPGNSSYTTSINSVVNGNYNYALPSFIGQATQYGQALTYGRVSPVSTLTDSLGGGETGEAFSMILGSLTGGLSQVIEGFFDLMNAQATNVDPVIALAKLGTGLTVTTVNTIAYMAVLVFDLTMALGALFGTTFSSAMLALTSVLTSALTPILITLMVTGLTLSFYLPLIPFILFTFGVVGWFITVIEAMCAAPLVALGITHPGGHPILGKSDPAVLLVVNLFIRPALMIIGLIAGIMLSYVSVWLLNKGFFHIMLMITTKGGGNMIITVMGGLIVYTVVVIQLMHKSFALTYIIPDQVFKWIGTNIQGMGGEEQAEQQIAGSVNKAVETTASAAGSAGQKMGESGAAVGNAMHEGAQKTISSVQKVGGSGGGGGGGGMSGG